MGMMTMGSAGDAAALINSYHNWELVRKVEQAGHTLIEVRFPDCSNYGGHKILLYEGTWDLPAGRLLNPHFSEALGEPVARFVPNDQGWVYGLTIMKAFDNE